MVADVWVYLCHRLPEYASAAKGAAIDIRVLSGSEGHPAGQMATDVADLSPATTFADVAPAREVRLPMFRCSDESAMFQPLKWRPTWRLRLRHRLRECASTAKGAAVDFWCSGGSAVFPPIRWRPGWRIGLRHRLRGCASPRLVPDHRRARFPHGRHGP